MNCVRSIALSAGAIMAFLLSGNVAFSQQATQPPPSSGTTIEELDQRIKTLERRVETKPNETVTKEENSTRLVAGKSGFILSSKNDDFQFRLKGYIQFDYLSFQGNSSYRYTDTFQLRRVRPIFEATLFKYYDFRIMPGFDLGKFTLFDAYGEVHYWPYAKLRFGKFKPPIGLERLQAAADLMLVERALPTTMVPSRDLGIQLHGDLLKGTVYYAVGVFNGVPDGGNGDNDSNDQKDVEGRLFFRPFVNTSIGLLKGIGFGISSSLGREDGATMLPSYKSSGGYTFFKYGSDAIAKGDLFRFSPQGYYYWGPIGILGEYVQSAQEVGKVITTKTKTTTTTKTKVTNVTNSSWQIAGSIVVTGGHASYTGVKPKKPFAPLRGGGIGEIELAMRYCELSIDNDAFVKGLADQTKSAKKAHAIAFGVNWYLNNNVKFMVDYEQTDFTRGSTKADLLAEKVILSRMQIAF